jgi:GDPmannose 4,6-dehydratase
MAKALVFGINGQDGFYLRRLLQQNKIEVTGVSRSEGDWLKGDVADRAFVESLIKSGQPDYIFHLAARSAVHHELLFEHQSTIVNGSLHILESVLHLSPASRVFITGSGLQFVNDGNPVSEKNEFLAGDAYSLARIQTVYAARYYRAKGVKTYVGYLFHHDSPLRSPSHLSRKIVDAVKDIASGKHISLPIGDVTVEKEFGFAGDIAKGMFHLVQQNEISEACIGTGKAYSIERWLEICFTSIGKNWREYVQLNNNYKSGFKRLVSNPSLLKSAGWKTEVNIEELAELMLKSSGAW